MAAPAPAPYANRDFSNPFNPCNVIVGGLVGGIAGALATEITFAGGMVFGSIYYCVNELLDAGLSFLGQSETAKTVRLVACILASIVISAALTSFIGFEVTFQTGVVLAIAMIITSCVTTAICCGSLVSCGFIATSQRG